MWHMSLLYLVLIIITVVIWPLGIKLLCLCDILFTQRLHKANIEYLEMKSLQKKPKRHQPPRVAEQQPVFYYNCKKHKPLIIKTMISKCKWKLYINNTDTHVGNSRVAQVTQHTVITVDSGIPANIKTGRCLREENVLQSSHMIRCWTLTSLHPTVATFIHSLTNSVTVTSETTRREGTRDKRVEVKHHRRRMQWNVCLETKMFCQRATHVSLFSPHL